MVKASDPVPLKFNPQVVKDGTRRANELVYFDCDRMRFVNGFPQSIGGWQKVSEEQVLGVPRSLFSWSTTTATDLMGVGTSWKYYIESGGSYTDITPVRASSTINSNPFSVTSGSSIVTVSDTSHGAYQNDFVTYSGATDTGGILAATLNAEHQIVSVIDADSYTIDVGTNASSTTTGGGASVTAAYQLTTGLDTTVLGGGWGAGTWSREGWGDGIDTLITGQQLRIWTQDNFGEDLLYNPRGGAIYYYDSSAGGRGTNIVDLPGANEAPVVADQILVVPDERTAIAFGCNPIGTSTADPMMVRWCDRETITEWEPTDVTTAGGFRLALGSKHMIALKTRQGVIEFTNKAMYAIIFNADGTRVPRLISDNTLILGPRAANVMHGVIYWMSTRGVMSYNGTPTPLPSGLTQYLYNDINISQSWKAHVGVNPTFNEVKFFYVSKDATEVDKYILYNVIDQTWAPGTLERTAWLEAGINQAPRAAAPDGYIYNHETGLNDGSTAPVSPLNSFIETNLFAIQNAKFQYRVRGIWPDVNFNGSTATVPQVTMELRLQNRQGSPDTLEELGETVRSVALPVEEFTDKLDVGKRGRFMALRVSCDVIDTAWQLGVPHLDLIQDGSR